MIRAKFKVASISRHLMSVHDPKHPEADRYGNRIAEVQNIHFTISYDPAFHASTPSGNFELGLLREEHARQFELGKEYYSDFSPAEVVLSDSGFVADPTTGTGD